MASSSSGSHESMFLVNHVFLPPKLPQEADNTGRFERLIVKQALKSLRSLDYRESTQGTGSLEPRLAAIDAAIGSMERLLEVHQFSPIEVGATINAEQLNTELSQLSKSDGMHAIPLKVSHQNAAILAYRHEDSMRLEIFELSPQNSSVIGTTGRLRRQFPGVALNIPLAKLSPSVIKTLAQALDKMSSQTAPGTLPSRKKDGRQHDENRDTAHPMIVTELLTAFMLPLGEAAKVTSIRKNTRDDVLWKSCKTPWRRSPMWLLVRVSIHLVFLRSGLEPTEARTLFKHFMVLFTSQVLVKVDRVLRDDRSCTEWCDVVHSMRAKIARRVLKLDKPLPRWMRRVVHDLTSDDSLQKAWNDVRTAEAKSSRVDLQSLQSLEFEVDTLASIPQLDNFVDGLSKRQGTTRKANFTPSCPLPEFTDIAQWFGHGSSKRAALHAACNDQQLTRLSDWLEPKLQQVPLDANSTCASLWGAMDSYESLVQNNCAGNPEAWSLMVLGVLELWVACDRVAVRECPLLDDYDPDIDARRLHSLLLPSRSQMGRLAKVEEYLSGRRARGFHKDIWMSSGRPNTFAVSYFDRSPEHQILRSEIEQKAWGDREKKRAEFTELKNKHARLIREYNTMTCSNVMEMRNGQPFPVHQRNCKKCGKKEMADGLEIHIHEWPLPIAEHAIKTVVFELRVPRWFSVWREATSFLRLKLLRCAYAKDDTPSPNSSFPLYDDVHLRWNYDSRLPYSMSPRIGLLSRVKPQTKTHYKAKKLTTVARVGDLLFDNASRWEYYDSALGCFSGSVSPGEGIEELARSMMYRLPNSSRAVQQFLYRPLLSPDGPSPNTVLATQSECPSHLSLTEYKALGTIPLGHHIQWQNILLQVAAPAVDFKKVEACRAVMLCMYQAGPRGKAWHREGHAIPASNEVFVEKMLHGLQSATVRIEDNWRCVNELGCYIAIARRILSLSANDRLKRDALGYLSYAREVAMSWIKTLKDRVDGSTGSEKSEFRAKVARAALVHADAFNVQDAFSTGDDVLTHVLTPSDNAAHFIETCITIQECYPPSNGPEPILYWRWQQLCVRAYPILYGAVVRDSSPALSVAIGRSWVAFNPDSAGWAKPFVPGCLHGDTSWLQTESLSQGGGRNLSVDYCLVTGELRVNGFPLNRLPSEYEAHPMYARLFGSSVLEVMPGDVPGMVFSGKKRYAGHQLHFGLVKNSEGGRDLLVRAVKDGRTWDFADPRLFRGFPHRFVSDHVHWYNPDSKTVEFRPQGDPWTASDENWVLRAKRNGVWQLAKGDDRILVAPTLLSARGDTAARMDSIFSPLVGAPHLELVYRPSLSLLEIELPRLKLAFHIKQGSTAIRSRQFRGMEVDTDQTIGTLVGLKNKLILKGDLEGKPRKVIFPDGPVICNQSENHTRVTISREEAELCHSFEVDTRLGRLVDNESLESKLLLSYLHALTSFCLPDPLTHRTGTEQALDILRSAAVKSFPVLSKRNIAILRDIARLTPTRIYYPEHMKEMQSVTWSPNLGFLAQHNSFYRAVTSLFDAADERAFLHKVDYGEDLSLERGMRDLLRRDEIRSSTFRVSQYGAEEHTADEDQEYLSRDVGQGSSKAGDAYAIADYLLNGRGHLPRAMPSSPREYVWNYLVDSSGYAVHGSPLHLTLGGSEDTPEYDARWLFETHHGMVAVNLLLYHDALNGRTQPRIEKPDVAIWLATLAFSEKANLSIIQLLATMSNERAMDSVRPPRAWKFIPNRGHGFNKTTLRTELNNDAVYRMFTNCPEFRVSENKGYYEERRMQDEYRDNRQRALRVFLDCAAETWPCAKPQLAHHARRSEWDTYVRTDMAISILHDYTVLWFDNYELEGHLGRLSGLIPRVEPFSSQGLSDVQHSASESIPVDCQREGFIGPKDVFLCPPPEFDSPASPKPTSMREQQAQASSLPNGNSQASLLDDLLRRLDSMADVAFEVDYVASLRESVVSLATRNHQSSVGSTLGIRGVVKSYVAICKDQAERAYSAICGALEAHVESLFTADAPPEKANGVSRGQSFSAFRPRLSPAFLLQNIARGRWERLPAGWKQCIVQYGVCLSQLRRAERMASAARRGDMAALSNELLNAGHTNWSPMEYPDSLLLEVESGITIRDVQEEIAARMRSPPESKNSVMQLNMGEGKSSVIVPIVASALADGTSIVRVLVAKPQSKQMLQMLTSKLGGLLDRVIYQLPFSRDVQATQDEAAFIRRMLEECRREGGVLLVQPEHVLSLQQMGTEFAISPERAEVARSLNMTRHYLFDTARDIVDESDENFSVKFELVYTMGLQQPVNHSPQRWLVIQEVLGLVQAVAREARREFPDDVEIHDDSPQPGSFPRTRVLKGDAMESILEMLADRICDSGIAGFPISQQTPAVREAARTYMTKGDLSGEEIDRVEREGPTGLWTENVRPTLALLRGLILGNVLAFTLMQKRWRVNYGLTSDRTPATRLAVPYRAKDQPSPRSEFSHPDVVIILTCLSYYYSGLTDEDMFLALDNLLRSDQAAIQYRRWVQDGDIPDKFKTLAGVNPEDREQCVKDVFPHLRFSKSVIDYYLDHIVYPKDMKEFPSKLSSSGWDLAEERAHPTTGFSGTNDSRSLLPLGMEQLDLQDQKHTNALVMSYLLQPETSVTDIPSRTHGSDADALLDHVVGLDPPVRVILDVGAQVLELGNHGVACRWLQKVLDENTQAVVFFNESDELSVVDQSGYVERLQTSPFASQLDACLVFLDEAHTRGTDLKLPTNYRAAVTLGANQTKDGLMQGCMRMRKLGHGQSVVFCVPLEIRNKIRELLPREEGDSDDRIQVSDILIWSIRETWSTLQRGVQLWAMQGRRHQKHHRLWKDFTGGKRSLSASEAEQFLEPEAQTILERYRPQAAGSNVEEIGVEGDGVASDLIAERLRDFGALSCDAAALHEEQERELAPEIETEQETELPPPTAAAAHKLHPDVSAFARSGSMIPNSPAYVHAFASLARTQTGREFGIAHLAPPVGPNLFVTADFVRTVSLPDVVGAYQDSYLRSVQWVLASRGAEGAGPSLLVISPYEANSLAPVMTAGWKTTLHIYTPRVNPAFPSLDDLSLFSFPRGLDAPIPEDLTVALDLFSGQLYFNDYDMYAAACRFLGISSEKAKEGETLDADGFILRGADGRVGGGSGLSKSPVKFFRDLMTLRRDSQAISGTHIGDVLDRRPLARETFD